MLIYVETVTQLPASLPSAVPRGAHVGLVDVQGLGVCTFSGYKICSLSFRECVEKRLLRGASALLHLMKRLWG